MFQRIRLRLFLLSLAVIVTVGGGVIVLVRHDVKTTAEQRLAAQLSTTARTAAALLTPHDESAVDVQHVERLLLELSTTTANQLRYFATPAAAAAELTNAGLGLPPVTMPPDWATSIVGSDTAFAAARSAGGGVIIVSRATTEIRDATARLDRGVVAAALFGLFVAMFMTWAATALIARSMRKLVADARDVVRGNTRRLAPEQDAERDELRDLRDWFNYLAADAERHTSDLARGRALLTSVLESMSQGVIALDSNGVVEAMNDQARKIIGLNSAPIGEVFEQFITVPQLLELARATTSRALEFALPNAVKVHVRMAPKRDTGGVVLVIEDVTNVRELETIRRDFVANVSHELRTPVAVIRANAETLSGGAKRDPEMASKLIDGLHRNAERLARILADLLDLSRLDAGHYRLDLGNVQLVSAIEQAAHAVEPLVKQRGCTLVIDAAPALRVRADAKALDQVLVNLIDNAVKYGAAPGTVTIAARAEGAVVRIEVIDDGPGLEPAHQKRVFERFYRADSSRSREAGGTGLGLAIVKHLIESMGGDVGVASALPHGSIFWVHLQASPAVA